MTHLNVFQTTAYTSKYNLPDNSRTREILIRRHQSIRRSVRAGSFREQVGFISTELQRHAPPTHLSDRHSSCSAQSEHNIPRAQKYYSLQPGGALEAAFDLRRRSHGEFVGMKSGGTVLSTSV